MIAAALLGAPLTWAVLIAAAGVAFVGVLTALAVLAATARWVERNNQRRHARRRLERRPGGYPFERGAP